MEITFTQYLIEDAKSRAATKRVVDLINSATNNKFKATVATKTGSLQPVLAITTKDGKIPSEVYDVFNKHKIGVGDKETEKNDDDTSTVKFYVLEV